MPGPPIKASSTESKTRLRRKITKRMPPSDGVRLATISRQPHAGQHHHDEAGRPAQQLQERIGEIGAG